MNISGIRRRSLFTTLFSLPVLAVFGVFGLIGCGAGSNTYSPTVKSNVPGFSIAVTPSRASVAQGTTANYTVTITETGGFNSAITLSASGLPTGTTATFGAQTPTASGSTATLAISTSDTAEESAIVAAASKLAQPSTGSPTRQVTPTGSTTITVTAVGGGITQSATATLVVSPAPSFTVAVTPSSVGVTQGNTANYTVTITEIGGFNSPITLSASGLPSGATATFGEFTSTASGETASLAISTSDINDSAIILNSKLAKPAAGSTTRQVTPTGSSTITVTATGGGITQTATTTLVVSLAPDFTMTLTPATAGSNTVAPGGTAKYIVTLTSVSGFSTPVALTLTGLPQNTTAAFGATTVIPTAAGATTTLNITTSFTEGAVTLPGQYTLTLNGTGGGITHVTAAAFNVGVFTISVTQASSGSGTVSQGQTAHYIITLTSLDGFAPVVTLTPPALPTGCTATFGATTLTPTAAGATTTLTITTTAPGSAQTTPVGAVNFDVGASGGGYVTNGSAPLNVTNTPYFTITVTQQTPVIGTPGSGGFTVTLTSVNGYVSAVTLTSSGLPANTTGSFTSQSVVPTPTGASTTFTLDATATLSGMYPFQITGTGVGFTTTVNAVATLGPG